MAEEAPGTSVSGSGDLAAKEEENVLSMVDVLQENQELEAEATAVLGDSDDKCCTYPQGYLARQALYACGTCKPDPPAGVCLACSYECHEGHQLFELYTKRNFRCDCGNSNFPNLTCKLESNKAPTNSDNKYNSNFNGLYCTCKRPYPDPEDEIEDEMIQCVVCEDWYHGRHLGSVEIPDNEDYQEMVCYTCMKTCDFLWAYAVHSPEMKIVKEETTDSVDVEGNSENAAAEDKKEIKKQETNADTTNEEDPAKPSTSTPNTNSKEPEQTPPTDLKESEVDATSKLADANVPPQLPQDSATKSNLNNDGTNVNSATSQQSKAVLPNGEKPAASSTPPQPANNDVAVPKIEPTDGSNKNDNETPVTDRAVPVRNGEASKEDDDSQSSNAERRCKLKELEARGVYRGEHATFWPTGWRSKLCTCESCKNMYAEKLVAFIIDESDSVLAYEQRGLSRQASSSSQYEQGMQALSSMNRIQQVEMLHGFNDLKAELTNYLKDFADQGKVVKREDIDKFFDDMQARKRQRVGEAGSAVQYLCR